MSVTSTVTFTNDISFSVQETLGGNVQRYNYWTEHSMNESFKQANS